MIFQEKFFPYQYKADPEVVHQFLLPTNSINENNRTNNTHMDKEANAQSDQTTPDEHNEEEQLPSVQYDLLNNKMHKDIKNTTTENTNNSRKLKRSVRTIKTPSYLIDYQCHSAQTQLCDIKKSHAHNQIAEAHSQYVEPSCYEEASRDP